MSGAKGWIERLLPERDEIFLDHVGFFAKDLETAASRLSLLGFQISPINVHYSATETGRLVPTGTSNRLVALRYGYLEVLAGSGSTPLAEELRKALAYHEGLHLIGLSHPDMSAQRMRLTEAGFAMQQVINLRRLVATSSGERQFACSVLRTQPGEMAEGRVQMLTNHTPELLWTPGSTVHTNGADALTDILICVENPAKEAQRYVRYTSRAASKVGNSFVIALDRGHILFVHPDSAQEMLPEFVAPRLPWIAGAAVRTADIHMTRRVLARNGVRPIIETDDIVCVGAAESLGAYLMFHSKATDLPWLSLNCS
jgi:Glyoxalase-like domain